MLTAIIIPTLIAFGGFAVDMGNAWRTKSGLQDAADGAMLAVARLNLSPRERKRRFKTEFRANMGNFGSQISDLQINIEQEDINRSLKMSAEISGNIETTLLKIMGVTSIPLAVSTSAGETRREVEIALVLDISSSMRGQKMRELRDAARDFVRTVLQRGRNNQGTTVSIVPYGGTVRLPKSFGRLVSITADPNMWQQRQWNGCLAYRRDRSPADIEPDFSTSQIDDFNDDYIQGDRFEFVPFISPYPEPDPWCPPPSTQFIPPTNKLSKLTAAISGFEHSNGTGTNHGALWGLKALSPKWRGRFRRSPRNRPLDFADENEKYMIIMTDGTITAQRTWKTRLDRAETRKGHKFFRPNPGYVLSYAEQYPYEKSRTNNRGEEVALDKRYDQTTDIAAEAQLKHICEIAKQKEITIYTIGFDVNAAHKVDTLRECASEPEKYYKVEQSELKQIFSKIASEISELRLTR